jgi:tripartite-type tricarboxylate transporter receptor subunit TctC
MNTFMKRLKLSLVGMSLGVTGICALAAAAQGQDFPSRSITVVVPFSAGGPSDVIARIVTEHMAKTLGQSLVIENVGAAGGAVGSGRVAAAAPDGYTLLAGSMGPHVAAPVLTPDIKYGPQDFAPIGPTAHSPAIIVARKDFPAKDLREFVAHLKTNGNAIKQAHGGIGSSSHMACLLFTSEIGSTVTQIAYRGSALGVNDMIGGHVDFLCEQSVSVSNQIASGAIKAYGVSASERLAALPDVPTAKEAGINYQMSIWAGMFAPRNTPQPIVAKISDALNLALDDASVRKRIGDLGGSIPDKRERNPGAFDAYVKAEVARWAPILKATSRPAQQ